MKKSIFVYALSNMQKQYDHDVARQKELSKLTGSNDVQLYNNEKLYNAIVKIVADGFEHHSKAIKMLNSFMFEDDFGRELNPSICYYDILWEEMIRECKLKIENK